METEEVNYNPEEEIDEEQSPTQKPGPQGGFKYKFIFMYFGVATLLAWNAVLSELGFFINYQSDLNPGVSFGFLNYILNIAFQFLMVCKKDLFRLKTELLIGLISSIFFLIAMPFSVLPFEKNDTIGMTLTASICILMGFTNALCCSGFFALVSHFPLDNIVALSTGQGVSGILMNLIEFAVLFFIDSGDTDKDLRLGALIFFGISALILIGSLIVLLCNYNSEYFQYYLSLNTEEKKEQLVGLVTAESRQSVADVQDSIEAAKQLEQSGGGAEVEGKSLEITFTQLFKMLMDIDLLTLFIYVVTFALFPNVCTSQKLFHTGKYRINTIIFIYNFFDTVGRFSMNGVTPTKQKIYVSVLTRVVFLVSLILNHYGAFSLGWDLTFTSIMLIVNVLLLAFTNGVASVLVMGIAPSLVCAEAKSRAGSSISFFIILGIFVGACIAIPVGMLMKAIGEWKEF